MLITKDIFDSPFLFRKWCEKLKPVYACDTETTSLHWLELDLIGFSLFDGKQACYVNLVSNKYRQELLDILKEQIDKAKLVIFHSAPFDLMVLRKVGIEI